MNEITKTKRPPRTESMPTTSSDVGATPSIDNNYGITIYCAIAQIHTRRKFNDVALNEFLIDVRDNGYADNKPGTTTIYPAHTIQKIEVTLVA